MSEFKEVTMSEFKEYLNESLRSYVYQIPSDYRKQVFDFYVWSYFYQRLDYQTSSDLRFIIEESTKKVSDYFIGLLKKCFAMAITQEVIWNHEALWETGEMYPDDLDAEDKVDLERYSKANWFPLFDKFYNGSEFSGRTDSFAHYGNMEMEIAKVFGTIKNFGKVMRQMFEDSGRIHDSVWANVCAVLEQLCLSDKMGLKEKVVFVDYCFDVCHNNGVVLDHIDIFGNWIKRALFLKSHAKFESLLAKSSIPNDFKSYLIKNIRI
jgi:hypothetical protein